MTVFSTAAADVLVGQTFTPSTLRVAQPGSYSLTLKSTEVTPLTNLSLSSLLAGMRAMTSATTTCTGGSVTTGTSFTLSGGGLAAGRVAP
ncbi:hypothetical protein MF271_22115 (plasmid) [Deinococcus sp. KNUC1210]|uniref:hypothetical protein n=1 Tax=Deinococcus sp. KNUC1210 TaxID=2917691 RepID=UPI001EF0829A|nr:hypothetical protein [Deinococcus sp. KNUC1210]ULH18174.1 hypothetical protein MF271_22115 [Deinococcus sp. KNUC1210]